MSLFKGISVSDTVKMNCGQINNYDLFPIFVASFVIAMFFKRSDKKLYELINFDLADISEDTLLSFERLFISNYRATGTSFGWSV